MTIYYDTLNTNGTITRRIGTTTLSAGTSTISDAMANSPYMCTQSADGTLSGQSITPPTGVSNATVYYVKATPTTETPTLPTIPLSRETTTYWELNTTTEPSSSSLQFLGEN